MKTILSILSITILAAVFAMGQSGDPLPHSAIGSAVVTGTTPSNGTSEVQTITLTGFSGGTNSVTFAGKSASFVLSSTNTNAQISTSASNALVSLATIGAGGVNVATTGTANRAIAVTFQGNLAKKDVGLITAAVTSGTNTVGVAVTTPGVTADGRSSARGQLLIDLSTGFIYSNTSSVLLQPAWTKASAQ